ncbi:aldehyde dehydrogenase (NADP(+)) [Sphaerisporangium sp. NBC_01403]|uniref:aldehyde dehydrogenase (NADP(+)) n=1 Tax=Sphaerisporangium sp. NBC_01403 TaxID=2903599 RepID=UPI003251ACC5
MPSHAPEPTSFRATSPLTGQDGPSIHEATPAEVTAAVAAATDAYRELRTWPPSRLAALLDAVAAALEDRSGEIVASARQETGLPVPALEGESLRTVGQLRMFSRLVLTGRPLEATIDHADPGARPPRPDLRRMNVPLGPVAVFGASNFPLAFGVAGGDTASALAAGCPVVVKGHPLHPVTSALCAEAVDAALRDVEAPEGTFALLQGASHTVARQLVTEPGIRAVGFTGSTVGGRALYDLAAARPEPIPVYAEMGSVNPVVISDSALRERGARIASELAASLLTRTGQLCTSPGLLFVPEGEYGDALVDGLRRELTAGGRGPMLSAGMAGALTSALAEACATPGVRLAAGGDRLSDVEVENTLVLADAEAFLTRPRLREEHFGPASVVVRYGSRAQLLSMLDLLPGSLTFTLHAEPGDSLDPVVALAAERAGRIVWNDYPTGVAVTEAMHHGGPYPATSAPAHTSVGPAAIRRFLRPVAYQNTPDAVLPEALREGNPLGLPRLVDSERTSGGGSGSCSRPEAAD